MGECKAGAALGTDGCTWHAKAIAKAINATCLYGPSSCAGTSTSSSHVLAPAPVAPPVLSWPRCLYGPSLHYYYDLG